MQRVGLPNGPLRSCHSTSRTNHVEPSNPRYWLTSSPNGQRPNSLESTAHIPIGLCILTAPKCWRGRSGSRVNIPHWRCRLVCTLNTIHRLQQRSRIRGPIAWSLDGRIHGHTTPRGARGFKPRNISNKWRFRCQRSEDGGLL